MLLPGVRLPRSRICEVIILPKHCSFNPAFFVGQSTALIGVSSFSTTTFMTSCGEISTKSPRAASTSIDVSLPYVTTQTIVNVGSSITASFTPAALNSAPQWISLTQVTTGLTSTADTVEPTIASTVKPTITPSVNGTYLILSECLQFHQVRLAYVG